MAQYVLFEAASGYGVFQNMESELIGSDQASVMKALQKPENILKTFKLQAYLPFKNSDEALQNAKDVTDGVCNKRLKKFIKKTLKDEAKSAESKTVGLGVVDRTLAGSIQNQFSWIVCVSDQSVLELDRAIRSHQDKLITLDNNLSIEKVQLGLAHSLSRTKVSYDINRTDNMIIQSISLLDQIDKDINCFAMRIREWYSWHFPELSSLVKDNALYAKAIKIIYNKSELTQECFEELTKELGDAALAQEIIETAKTSMGSEVTEMDLMNIKNFSTRVINLASYRTNLHQYLVSKMSSVAPNLSALIGDIVGARLISNAGSLTNLSKQPASTIQILGAEKALFRALKARTNTPKYGLIFHSSFISKSEGKFKGRISRFLANKCAMASRIDCYSVDNLGNKYGQAFKTQVENRISFFQNSETPMKNAEVISSVLDQLKSDNLNKSDSVVNKNLESLKKESYYDNYPVSEESMMIDTPLKESIETPKKTKKSKKSKSKSKDTGNVETAEKLEESQEQLNQESQVDTNEPLTTPSKSSEKKKSKRKKTPQGDTSVHEAEEAPDSQPKQKKKKNKKDKQLQQPQD